MGILAFEFLIKRNCLFLFLVVLHLHCCSGVSLVVASVGYSLVAVHNLLSAVTSLFVDHGLWGPRASVVAAAPALEHRLNSCGTWV